LQQIWYRLSPIKILKNGENPLTAKGEFLRTTYLVATEARVCVVLLKELHMKIVAMISAVALLAASSALAGGIRIGDTVASRIAKDPTIPGKGKAGQCLPFARALQQKFEAAGISARVVVYGYEAEGAAPGAAPAPAAGRASHAVVVYEDKGRTYIMDNQSWKPVWVHQGAPMQMAQQFSGFNTNVRMAHVVAPEVSPKQPGLVYPNVRIAAN
jgi:hypothetical protein